MSWSYRSQGLVMVSPVGRMREGPALCRTLPMLGHPQKTCRGPAEATTPRSRAVDLDKEAEHQSVERDDTRDHAENHQKLSTILRRLRDARARASQACEHPRSGHAGDRAPDVRLPRDATGQETIHQVDTQQRQDRCRIGSPQSLQDKHGAEEAKHRARRPHRTHEEFRRLNQTPGEDEGGSTQRTHQVDSEETPPAQDGFDRATHPVQGEHVEQDVHDAAVQERAGEDRPRVRHQQRRHERQAELRGGRQQGHDVHVAYETSGNIAVGDEEVVRFMHFINGFNQLFANEQDEVIKSKYKEIKEFLKNKKEGDIDSQDIRTIKGLIRRGEARTASTFNQIPLDHVHFLDLPFYESGKIEKLPMGEADVNIVRELITKVKPHQIYVAGDLADPHGTHRKCTDAVLAAIDLEKEAKAEWLKDCRVWMYRGAWAEWEIENIEMCVPISPEELRAKRNSILKHQSQMESAPFLGNDERLFWQRSEDRNRGTAKLYDDLGLACYEAMEAFVEYKF